MKRRRMFLKIRPIIIVLSFIFSVFGKKMNLLFFSIFRRMPGYIGQIVRYIFLKNCIKEIGDNVTIGPGVYFKWPERIKIGNNVTINEMCYIEGVGEVHIGNDVAIAHASTIMSSNHTYDIKDLPMNLNPIVGSRIIIEDDVWLGCGVRILAGVHIKSRTIVAAGAVVNKSFEGNTILGGVPAKIIKNID